MTDPSHKSTQLECSSAGAGRAFCYARTSQLRKSSQTPSRLVAIE
jgi:hypothetical protein